MAPRQLHHASGHDPTPGLDLAGWCSSLTHAPTLPKHAATHGDLYPRSVRHLRRGGFRSRSVSSVSGRPRLKQSGDARADPDGGSPAVRDPDEVLARPAGRCASATSVAADRSGHGRSRHGEGAAGGDDRSRRSGANGRTVGGDRAAAPTPPSGRQGGNWIT